MSNKDETAYDPFPKTGLVRKYAAFIRKEVREYSKMYTYVRYEEMLAEAIKIAVKVEKGFDPNIAKDFSTPLRWWLLGLHRFAQKQFSSWQVPVSKAERDANELERKRNGIGGDDPRAVNFSGSGNGARIALDFQWLTDLLEQDHRHRVVIGTQLRNNDWDHANGVVDNATPLIKVVLEGQKPSPITHGYLRAALDYSVRQQREADQEAENQRNGDYAPVFLKPDQQQIDMDSIRADNHPRTILTTSRMSA
jgi:hypothetical protein